MSALMRAFGRLKTPVDVMVSEEIFQVSDWTHFLADGMEGGVIVAVDTGGHSMLGDETSQTVYDSSRCKVRRDIQEDCSARQTAIEGYVDDDFISSVEDAVGAGMIQSHMKKRALQLDPLIGQHRQVVGRGQLCTVAAAFHTGIRHMFGENAYSR